MNFFFAIYSNLSHFGVITITVELAIKVLLRSYQTHDPAEAICFMLFVSLLILKKKKYAACALCEGK
jgi:hypothetical protein